MVAGVVAGAEEPFYAGDLDAAKERLALWRSLLPGVEPHYAVKCNGDAALILTLAAEGVGFDCASASEIKAALALGVPPSRILYANPVKQPSHVRYAAEAGVPLTVFDGEAELHKMARLAPSTSLLLRVAVDDSQAQCVLSNKYGAPPADAERLLTVAYGLGLAVGGVSFHVGSGSGSADAFSDAVARAAAVFTIAERLGHPMTVLDIGGGFPGVDAEHGISFATMATTLRAALDYFPRVAASASSPSPGASSRRRRRSQSASLVRKSPSAPPPPTARAARAARATRRRRAARRVNYFVNDGLYGSFNCVLYDHAAPECYVLPTAAAARRRRAAVLDLGPTCDGIDCVIADTKLPDLEVGAWLWFPAMGAYTSCAGSNFNGMDLPDVVYLQARGRAAAAAAGGGDGGDAEQPPTTASSRSDEIEVVGGSDDRVCWISLSLTWPIMSCANLALSLSDVVRAGPGALAEGGPRLARLVGPTRLLLVP